MLKHLKPIDLIAMILVIVGALNWGLVGGLNMNLVTMIFGDGSMLTRIVYGLVGVSGIWMLISLFKGK